MDESDFSSNELKIQFENMIRDILPSRLVSNFIIVAEVANNESSELSVSVSDGMSPWLADGMLKYASDMIASGELNDD
jgi:hypothetical protein